MFQLILHHPYTKAAAAVDVSGLYNHGSVHHVTYVESGVQPDSGSLDFGSLDSRVRVRSTPVFSHLHALKLEVVAKVRSLGQRRNLVEGEGSFAFFIHPDGTLWGTALSRIVPGQPLEWIGANTDLPGGARVVPGEWTKFTYIHDGFSSISLYINDQRVAFMSALCAPIQAVQAGGVNIGSWPGGDDYVFDGQIDDVKVWRYDPAIAYYQFFSRDFSPCWAGVFSELTDLGDGAERRRRLKSLMQCISSVQASAIRQLRKQGDQVTRVNEKFARRYHQLWQSNALASREMEELLTEWLRWLDSVLGAGSMKEFARTIAQCFDRHLQGSLEPAFDLTECDPAFTAYIKALMALLRD